MGPDKVILSKRTPTICCEHTAANVIKYFEVNEIVLRIAFKYLKEVIFDTIFILFQYAFKQKLDVLS